MINGVMKELETKGLRVSAVPTSHLSELGDEIASLTEGGSVGSELKAMLSRFRFAPPDGLESMQTVLCVARPSPIGRVAFLHDGKRLAAATPPTYSDYVKIPPIIEKMMNDTLGKHGCSAIFTRNLPNKLLAARSGLSRYGRNNISYVEGMGSFVFLSAFFTDMPCEEDIWGEAKRMDRCEKCPVCVKACPTGAIRADRRVIDAERCLTMHNEKDSAVPFPEWVGSSAHNSLVGCLACQTTCPANKAVLEYKSEPVEFDEGETALMLAGTPIGELPPKTVKKMEKLSIESYYEVIPRNLKALFQKAQL